MIKEIIIWAIFGIVVGWIAGDLIRSYFHYKALKKTVNERNEKYPSEDWIIR